MTEEKKDQGKQLAENDLAHPLVTIGIPTYKRPHLLPRALESVARQTYQPIEVIVCDDATPGDENEKVITAFKDKIPNLKYLKNPTNLGFGANCLRSVEEAQGEFFVWLMDDDEISPRYVEASVKTLLDYPEAVCATPYILAGSCKYFPANHTEDSWFRRIFIQLLLPIISDKAGMTSFSMLFSVTRTSIARKAMREALWRWEALRSHNNATADGHFCFLKLCLGQAVPIADREAVYILHADTGKEYEYIGKHTDTNSFFQNQRDKFWMMSDYVKGYADFVKIVYDRGRWRCALPFGLLILVILLYMAGSSLYQQVRGRWRKILGKEERMRN